VRLLVALAAACDRPCVPSFSPALCPQSALISLAAVRPYVSSCRPPLCPQSAPMSAVRPYVRSPPLYPQSAPMSVVLPCVRSPPLCPQSAPMKFWTGPPDAASVYKAVVSCIVGFYFIVRRYMDVWTAGSTAVRQYVLKNGFGTSGQC